MDKLILKQSNITEKVTTDIIESIYNIVSNTPLPLLSDLRGNLTVSHAYDDSVTYLNTNYPNLIINVTDGKYIRFTDPNMETYMISQKVDLDNDTHITIDEVKSKTVFRNELYSFMNYSLFTKITTLYPLEKYLNQDITELYLDNYKNGQLKTIDISRFNNLQQLYIVCPGGTSINTEIIGLQTLTTNNIVKFGIPGYSAQYDTLKLEYNTPKLIDLQNAFEGVTRIKTIDLSIWDMSNVNNIIGIFSLNAYNNFGYNENSTLLENIIFPTSFTCNKCTSLYNIFGRCKNLKSISNIETWDTSNVTSISLAFFYTNLTSYDFVFNNWNLTSCTDFSRAFDNIQYTGDIIFPESWLNIKPNTIYEMFSSVKLNKLDMKNFDMSSVNIGYNEINMAFGNPKYLDISGWYMPKINSIYELNMNNVIEINMKNFYTPSITTIRNLFNNCNNMTTLNIEMYSNNMTNICASWSSSLISLDLHRHECTCTNGTKFIAWDETAENCNVSWCFYNMSKLTSINLTDFKVHTNGNIESLFNGCTKIETIDLSLWDGTITSAFRSFYICTNLKTLDISGFDFDSTLSGDKLSWFVGDTNLITVYVKDNAAKIIVDKALIYSGLSITSTVKS